MDFNGEEANAIYYGIVATASKYHLSLATINDAESAVDKFLAGIT